MTKQFKPSLSRRFEGENHILMIDRKFGIKRAEFCGPNTKIEKRVRLGIKPLNETDSVCEQHDIDYVRITRSRVDEIVKGRAVRVADEKMIERLKRIVSINSAIASNTIKAKIVAENLGLLSKTRFVSF